MSDNNTTVITLIEAVEQFRDDRDWRKYHTPKNLASAITIEAAELLEVFQWRDDQSMSFELWTRLSDELADVLIYCLSLASVAKIDITTSIHRKMAINAAKYPPSEKDLTGWDRNHT